MAKDKLSQSSVSADLQNKIKLLTGKDFWNTQEYPQFNARSFRFSDGPHGLRLQSGSDDNFGLNGSCPATCFEENSCAACSWDEDILYGAGVRLGQEAAYFGASVLLGPAVNIKRNPLCGRNFEYFSEDPYLTGKLASAYIKGVQQNGVSCCVKHFAANNREFARSVCDSVLSERALREVYLLPFEMCVTEGEVGAVMTAYNKVNGVHCSQNKWLISDILRGEWNFDGIVVSDWVGTCDRVEGVKAGEDIEMPCCPLSCEELENAVKEGKLNEEDIDGCVKRISAFSQKWTGSVRECDFDEHSDFARRCAENSIVLLKNDGVLPLKKGVKVAVVGELAQKPHIQGGGSAKVSCKHTEDILSCLKEKFEVTGYEKGYSLSGKYSKKLLKRAVKLAKGADAVICFSGTCDRQDTEGADKSGISLPLCQTQLIKELAKTGKKVIVCLACGSAVQMEFDCDADALVYSGLYGQSGAKALSDILCGDVCPSGKLAESFPVSYSDLPCSGVFGSDAYKEEYKEDIFVGYRWFEGAGISPKYPFGYGLSYTDFEYSDVETDENGVSFTIKNAGSVDGKEVAQVYVSFPDCGIAQPAKVLKGFKKVSVKAGESVAVYIPFDEKTFRTFDEKRGAWRIFAGEYTILVGSSSRDIRLVRNIKVDGEQPECGGGYLKRQKIIEEAKRVQPERAEEDATRIEITLYSPFEQLKRAKGAGGRLLYFIGSKIFSSKKNPSLQTLRYLYMRAVAQYAGFNGPQTQGLLLACNGHFFKGLKKIIFKK
ncbi:MAG: glycoside hydrolase family 3 C-terminal domain-containing protein [Clostridia bacterium]|nr:glycoside hydrolase family 3 C-terminal domain-containing protein [Clostridia bacterium]